MDPQTDDQFERQFFDYVLDVSVVGNAVQQPSQLQILSDADFECWWLSAVSTSSLLKVLMKEQATGRDFIGTTASTVAGTVTFNGININNWAGSTQGGAMFPLAVPYIMPATRVYTILLTDSSGATNTVEICFRGFKLWPRPKTS
jgi:hypothetical protein